MKPPKKLKQALFDRWMKAIQKKFADELSDLAQNALFQVVIMQCQMWQPPGADEEFDICAPSLRQVCDSDRSLAKLFTTSIFGNVVGKIIARGERGLGELLRFEAVGNSLLQLPEDSEIGDMCAQTLLDAQMTMTVLRVVGVDRVDTFTDSSAYDQISNLDNETGRTAGEPSCLNCVAMAIQQNAWWRQRLDLMLKHLVGWC